MAEPKPDYCSLYYLNAPEQRRMDELLESIQQLTNDYQHIEREERPKSKLCKVMGMDLDVQVQRAKEDLANEREWIEAYWNYLSLHCDYIEKVIAKQQEVRQFLADAEANRVAVEGPRRVTISPKKAAALKELHGALTVFAEIDLKSIHEAVLKGNEELSGGIAVQKTDYQALVSRLPEEYGTSRFQYDISECFGQSVAVRKQVMDQHERIKPVTTMLSAIDRKVGEFRQTVLDR